MSKNESRSEEIPAKYLAIKELPLVFVYNADIKPKGKTPGLFMELVSNPSTPMSFSEILDLVTNCGAIKVGGICFTCKVKPTLVFTDPTEPGTGKMYAEVQLKTKAFEAMLKKSVKGEINNNVLAISQAVEQLSRSGFFKSEFFNLRPVPVKEAKESKTKAKTKAKTKNTEAYV